MAYNRENELNYDILSWDIIINYLKENIELKRSNQADHWVELLNERVANSHRDLARTTPAVNNYMQWIRSRAKCIKTSAKSIPSSILGPKITEGEIIDVRVSCRGPDDKLYDKDEQLRQRLPRGCTLIQCRLKDEGQPRLDFGLFALRKFSGGLGDDDDRENDNQAWLRYFLEHPRTASQIICTKKINGEACHLSCISLPPDNRLVLIAGSKNVHICFRTHSDILAYGNESTYNYASSFCHTILDTLSRMPDKGSKLLNFLSLTRYTAVFEILNYDHQHVVNLSYLKDEPNRSELKFITFAQVPQDFDAVVTNLCALPPDYAIEIARCLHLSATEYDIIENEPHILNEYLTSIKYRHECEGSVLYFLNKNDQVIGLLKKKTIWYVLLRAIREKARPMLSHWEKDRKMDLPDTLERVTRRFNAIQKWLLFSNEILHQWQMLAKQFITWIAEEGKRKKITRVDVADEYPKLWSRFLQETNNNDNFMKAMTDKNGEEDVWKQLNEMKIEEKKPKYDERKKTKQPSDLEYEEDIDLSLKDADENDEEN
ncbi:unnamed protein product [Adineta steineri]|uniref:DUF7920 domain-containing protein n=1 Tax=Adineta steineri TaxID=433720 RepID=A0A815FY19_9BILA|nr:unnamed protein product [Adineta steineri]CAF3483302.1 unnamed protein product [Adineta steineri]